VPLSGNIVGKPTQSLIAKQIARGANINDVFKKKAHRQKHVSTAL
jgi:hypothetical protein